MPQKKKRCFRCNQTKALRAFYVVQRGTARQSATDVQKECKKCTKLRIQMRYRERRDEILARAKKKYRSDSTYRAKVKAYSRERGRALRRSGSAAVYQWLRYWTDEDYRERTKFLSRIWGRNKYWSNKAYRDTYNRKRRERWEAKKAG